MIERWKQVERLLPERIKIIIQEEQLQVEQLQEIRLRIGRPPILIYRNQEWDFPMKTNEQYIVTKEDMRELMDYISQYSLYAFESELRRGYLTVEGGHRVGVAGKVLIEKNEVKTIQSISSANIRIAHEVIGCADQVMPYVMKRGDFLHTIIISSPKCGKTTLIRDLIRQLSDGSVYASGQTVSVIDERSELGACYKGIPQNDLGKRTDILDGCPKAEGIEMMIRAMSPSVLAIDEIGGKEEIRALEYGIASGCKLLASVHAKDLEEFFLKPGFEKVVEQAWFDRYIILQNQPEIGTLGGIYDKGGKPLCIN